MVVLVSEEARTNARTHSDAEWDSEWRGERAPVEHVCTRLRGETGRKR